MSRARKAEHDAAAFLTKVRSWSDHASATEHADWEAQLRILNEACDLITPDLSLKEVISAIYGSVNQLMDAYQFAVGLYDEKENTILFRGLMENNQSFPDLIVDASDAGRFAPWCILHGEIFINDMDLEFSKYVSTIPRPKLGTDPKAALYVPLRSNGKVTALITVRTPHKGAYCTHHLRILRTLGSFVLRTLDLSQEHGPTQAISRTGQMQWAWCSTEDLPPKAKRASDALTPREKEVLLHMASGLSNKAIAEKLFVSSDTIKTHTLNLYLKMEVGTRTAAIMKAIQLGWLV
jgi:DNA-binding CsgD family transcriptional regulator/transcriptional regulator with GAF, ATPase, and Fis domain